MPAHASCFKDWRVGRGHDRNGKKRCSAKRKLMSWLPTWDIRPETGGRKRVVCSGKPCVFVAIDTMQSISHNARSHFSAAWLPIKINSNYHIGFLSACFDSGRIMIQSIHSMLCVAHVLWAQETLHALRAAASGYAAADPAQLGFPHALELL